MPRSVQKIVPPLGGWLPEGRADDVGQNGIPSPMSPPVPLVPVRASDRFRFQFCSSRPLLVGESNPYGADPAYALWPAPVGCAGDRLCRAVMGLRPGTYLAAFVRTNLLGAGAWSAPRAQAAAARIVEHYDSSVALVLLGARVAAAFGVAYAPAPRLANADPRRGRTVGVLPHPSGRCRAWSDPAAVGRARDVLRAALPGVPLGEVEG